MANFQSDIVPNFLISYPVWIFRGFLLFFYCFFMGFFLLFCVVVFCFVLVFVCFETRVGHLVDFCIPYKICLIVVKSKII